MSNHKIYFTNGQTINISFDKYEFNKETNSYDFYFNNEVSFSIKPKTASIEKIEKVSPLATGFKIPKNR